MKRTASEPGLRNQIRCELAKSKKKKNELKTPSFPNLLQSRKYTDVETLNWLTYISYQKDIINSFMNSAAAFVFSRFNMKQ